jgi:hypothetical protein
MFFVLLLCYRDPSAATPLEDSGVVLVHVVDVNEPPSLQEQFLSVLENAPIGTKVLIIL